MFTDSSGRPIPLGNELGKGAAARVYLHGKDKSRAVKIFRQEYLLKEHSLPTRLRQLHRLSQAAHLEVEYAGRRKSVGSLPRDIVMDGTGAVVGFTMDTVSNGIDLTQVIFARDSKTAFYKHRNEPTYQKWLETFLYHPEGLRNRFILSYYLAVYFEKLYDLRTRDGKPLELDLCNFDIKPNNIMVSLEFLGGRRHIIPYILDLDNLTLSNSTGRISPVHPQFTPEYKAPEGPIDKYFDYYSIAVILYQLIFDIHPFHGVMGGTRFMDGTEMDFFVRNKCFPWGRNRKFLSRETQQDIRHSNFIRVSEDLQGLFLRAFDADMPESRPDMKEWATAMAAFLQNPPGPFSRLFKFP